MVSTEQSDISIDWEAVNWKRMDDAVLALLLLGLHDGNRAWKGFDWKVLNRLHEGGLITNPRSKARSVILTPEGIDRSHQLFEELFSQRDG